MPGAVEVYRRTRKVPDLFWNRFVCRPIAAPIVAVLARSRVTPNQITLTALVVAAAAALLLIVVPGYWGALGAVIVFELSYVLDCADGMLARLRGTQSVPGHLLDFLMDEIKAFFVLGAVAVRLHGESSDVRYLLVGIGGLVALATGVAITTFQRRPEIAGDRGASPVAPSPSLVRRAVLLAERGAKLLIHYPSYILLVAIAGRLDLYLYAYVGVNAAYALRSLASVASTHGRCGAAASPRR